MSTDKMNEIMDKEKVILTDDELMGVVGGAAVGSTDAYCDAFDTAEDATRDICANGDRLNVILILEQMQ